MRFQRQPGLICLYLALALCGGHAQAWCIVAPEMDGPYGRVIAEMVDGIQTLIPESTLVNVEDDTSVCQKKSNEGTILLGPSAYKRWGHKLAPSQKNIVVAVRPTSNEAVDHWIEYIPSPSRMLEKLTPLQQNLRTIHVMIDESWSTNHKRETLQAFSDTRFKLITHRVTSPKQALTTVRQLLKKMDSASEALWISHHHGNYGINSLVAMIAKEGLRRRQTTIANNVAWIDKGIFLGFFPDNLRLGKQIGSLALDHSSTATDDDHILYIEDLKSMINTKTMRFINKKMNKEQLSHIFLQLPKN